MKKIVVMPGGFHPFHAGHYALYQSAVEAFPDADVYVAATADTSTRPFPFPVKQKLAKLAGVPEDRFVQVKSPFRAEEITSRYNPEQDVLIFVRSEKDQNSQPKPGGVKKDGSPSYLQPYTNAVEPFAKHAYMAYLPTVEFGPGITSASEIRAAWPNLDERRKTAMVMSLYPRTQGNPKLAATVRKMLDTAIVGEVTENQGWAATYEEIRGAPNGAGAGMTAGYQRRENQPIAEKQRPEIERDPELKKARLFAKQHYPEFSGDEELAYDKWVQRSIQHGLEDDQKQYKVMAGLAEKIKRIETLVRQFKDQRQQQNESDYIEEKWSEKYKRSINCNNPRGFSQRAHCAGRKK